MATEPLPEIPYISFKGPPDLIMVACPIANDAGTSAERAKNCFAYFAAVLAQLSLMSLHSNCKLYCFGGPYKGRKGFIRPFRALQSPKGLYKALTGLARPPSLIRTLRAFMGFIRAF